MDQVEEMQSLTYSPSLRSTPQRGVLVLGNLASRANKWNEKRTRTPLPTRSALFGRGWRGATGEGLTDRDFACTEGLLFLN